MTSVSVYFVSGVSLLRSRAIRFDGFASNLGLVSTVQQNVFLHWVLSRF